jgi:hypothetical protein
MADFREYEHGTDWESFVAKTDARFMVMANHTFEDKTRILLHLPDVDHWQYFMKSENQDNFPFFMALTPKGEVITRGGVSIIS